MARSVRRTVLICCEGKSDRAFLAYLNSLYCSGRQNPPKVTTRQAGGKGGDNVIATLLGEARGGGYDRLVALLDADVPPGPGQQRRAKAMKVLMVTAEPCLEGLVLAILGQPVPAASAECKARLRTIEGRELFEPGVLSELLPRRLLDGRRESVSALRQLLESFD